MAQWKSVPFTPERSLVRSQLGPLYTPNRITRGWGFCDVAGLSKEKCVFSGRVAVI